MGIVDPAAIRAESGPSKGLGIGKSTKTCSGTAYPGQLEEPAH